MCAEAPGVLSQGMGKSGVDKGVVCSLAFGDSTGLSNKSFNHMSADIDIQKCFYICNKSSALT